MIASRKQPPNQWRPGVSGNPRGRPKGSSTITRMRESLVGDVKEILDALVVSAKAGDSQAARLVLERVLPPLKGVELPVTLSMPQGGSLTQQASFVLQAAAGGQIALSQASQMIGALATMARLVEVDELAQRITALEERDAKP